MTKYTMHTIKCPYCKNEFNENIAEILDNNNNENNFSKFRKGLIFNIRCKHCFNKFFYDHSLKYIDNEKKFFVHYIPSVNELRRYVSYLDEKRSEDCEYIENDYKFRIVVGNVQSFLEKVDILTYGLDDYIIEGYKTIIIENDKLVDVKNIYLEFNQDFNKCRFAVYFNDETMPTRLYQFNKEVYDDIFNCINKENRLTRNNDYIVNQDLIYKLYNKENDDRPIHRELIENYDKTIINELRNKAVDTACEGNYEEALTILEPLANSGDSLCQNDLGVVYERMKNYEKAEYWYKKSDTKQAIQNLLTLYDNKRVPFEQKEYLNACKKLVDMKDEYGYLYLSYFYQDDSNLNKDYNKAFEVLLKGLLVCKERRKIIFELGYLLESGVGCNIDNYKSHYCYELLLDDTSNIVAHYNYGLQCYQGRGCTQDVDLAIKHFEIAVVNGKYKDAINYLIEIYSTDEYKNDNRLSELYEIKKDIEKKATK